MFRIIYFPVGSMSVSSTAQSIPEETRRAIFLALVEAQDRKLTVSIATISPVSTLIHFGINIFPDGAPVPAIGLAELVIDSREFAEDLMRRVAQDLVSISRSIVKVKAVQ